MMRMDSFALRRGKVCLEGGDESAARLTLGQGFAAARRWVERQGRAYPGFVGAYVAGSYAGAADGRAYDPTSDIDVVLVLERTRDLPKPGKFVCEGVLLEVSLLPAADFRDERTVLTTHYIGYALSRPTLLADPTGLLARAAGWVARRYAQPQWVRERCQGMLARIRGQIAGFDPAQDYPACASGYLFTVGITTFPILLAAQDNCTVRKRYCAARQALTRRGLERDYPRLLGLIDPKNLSAARLEAHLQRMEAVFDAACATRGPSRDYAFRQDISPEARPVAIDGSRALIRSDHPGEAVFWMGATFARCHTILSMDDPARQARYLPDFTAFMADLGAETPERMAARLTALRDDLPWIEQLAERVLAGSRS